MARARNVKPGFFKNEELAECTPWARLCFIGLWTLADREGRLEDRAKRIKAELFAFDSVDVELLLQELAKHRFIVRYEAHPDHLRLIQIANFTKHQTPHFKEAKSAYPPHENPGLLPHSIPPKPKARPGLNGLQLHEEPKTTPRQAPAPAPTQSGADPGLAPPDSLIPHSLIPDSSNSGVSDKSSREASAQTPTHSHLVAKDGSETPALSTYQALKTMGIAGISEGDIKLRVMLAQGATAEEIVGIAQSVKGTSRATWAWVSAAVQGKRNDAAQLALTTAPPAPIRVEVSGRMPMFKPPEDPPPQTPEQRERTRKLLAETKERVKANGSHAPPPGPTKSADELAAEQLALLQQRRGTDFPRTSDGHEA